MDLLYVLRRHQRWRVLAVLFVLFLGDLVRVVNASPVDMGNGEACIGHSSASDVARCTAVVDNLLEQAHARYVAGEAQAAQPYISMALRILPRHAGALLEQALVYDATDQAVSARLLYDSLQDTRLQGAAAVPSAINLAQLGRYDQARQAFMTLTGSRDAYTASYAHLWLLWLRERTWQGEPDALRARLANEARGMRVTHAYHQALFDLYAGQGSVERVFAAIDATVPADPQQRRDARTETAFFAGGYLQYAMRDEVAARALYRAELPKAFASSERPLIQQSLAALGAATH